MEQTTDTYLGLDCLRLSNGRLTIRLTRTVGPRLLTLQLDDGPNLLAELPDFTIPCPGAEPLHLWGGHRQWLAPEVAAITYAPDVRPIDIQVAGDTVHVNAPAEPFSGAAIGWRLHLPAGAAALTIEHTLTNQGASPLTGALWVITQLRVGGTAILPQNTGLRDRAGLQPNRAVALWPYSDVNSPFLTWGNEYLLIKAGLSEGALKVGWPNPSGWLAYHWDDTLFIKETDFIPNAEYYDLGSSSQCYVNREFLELETLSPRVTLDPGWTVTHREAWRVEKGVLDPAGLVARLGA